ncbi:MAG: formyltransferase family protein [Anaerolineae bacterium]
MSGLIFFGMQGVLSLPPLRALLEAGVEVKAVLIPAAGTVVASPPRLVHPPRPAPTDLPILNPHLDYNIIHLAWEHGLPVWEVGSLAEPQTLALLAGLRPDLIVVACFPYIFPAALLQLPRYGCLNLHPSLLPAYRGPLPLFWQAYFGEPQTGVTLHFLNQSLDAGDIVAQTAFAWPEGASRADLEQQCGLAGAQLLAEAVQRLAQGEPLPRRPQPQAGSSYFSFPTAEDFYIPTTWEARRAFNFMRAAGTDWPLLLEVREKARTRGGEKRFFAVRMAISCDSHQKLDRPYLIEGDEIGVQFSPGTVRLKIQ